MSGNQEFVLLVAAAGISICKMTRQSNRFESGECHKYLLNVVGWGLGLVGGIYSIEVNGGDEAQKRIRRFSSLRDLLPSV